MIALLEKLSIEAWPGLSSQLYDGWLLQASEGYTNRANAIYPLETGVISLQEKVAKGLFSVDRFSGCQKTLPS